jgi:UrcA family protein
MVRMTTLTAFTLALTAATGFPATAQQLTRVVSYRDLDLATAHGARTFRHRVAHAVNYVCRFAHAGDDMLKSENQQCRENVAAAIKPKMTRAIEIARARSAATEFASR